MNAFAMLVSSKSDLTDRFDEIVSLALASPHLPQVSYLVNGKKNGLFYDVMSTFC